MNCKNKHIILILCDIEEETLKTKIDTVWKYFNDKNSKLDDEIKDEELKLTKKRDFISEKVRFF